MKKRILKWAVMMISGVVVTLSSVGNVVSAAENTQIQEEEIKVIKNPLNYIYINEPQLEVGNTQSIVLSWGENISEIQDITLTIENEKGLQTVLGAEKRVDELFLYEHSFEKGIYYVAGVNVTTNLGTRTFTAEELDIDVYFGVGKRVDESAKSDYVEMESKSIENSVVTIETNNVAIAQRSIADALSEQESQFSRNMNAERVKSEAAEKRDANLVIVLDPGHDASKHPGAASNGVREEIVTLKIAEYCKEVLEQYSGVSVYMTRTDGNCPFPGTSSIEDIIKRVDWAKTKDADAFISFHINSGSSAAQGAEVYYPKGEKDAQNLAKNIVSELAKLGLKNRGDKGDDSYAVIRQSKRNGFPGLIIEHAFVSNPSDVKWFQTEENLKRLGEADAAGIVNYYGLTKGNWEFTDQCWRWREGNGKYATSTWKSINGTWYYFDADSNMTTGWQQIGGSWYYMTGSGAMVTGWQQIGGNWYYMTGSGAMVTGWQQISGSWYYMTGSGAMVTGWQQIGGKWYYMTGSGAMVTDWQQIDNQKYYFNDSGVMLKGWQIIDNEKYYFHPSGHLLKGNQIIDGTKWYLNEDTGVLCTGWRFFDEQWFYYSSTGFKQTGWQKINGSWYYMAGSGAMVTGWQQIGGSWYYMTGSGTMTTGWQQIGGKWYYMDSSGVMTTGWKLLGNNWYYMDGSGAMLTGFQTVGNQKCYFDGSGVMQSGWQFIDKVWYYFNDYGYLLKGEQIISGQKWYLDENTGALYTGWQFFDEKWYYYTSVGMKQIGWQRIGNQTYYFNGSGEMQTGWQFIDSVWYYFESSGELNDNPSLKPPLDNAVAGEYCGIYN